MARSTSDAKKTPRTAARGLPIAVTAGVVAAGAALLYRMRSARDGDSCEPLINTSRARRTTELARVSARTGSNYAAMKARSMLANEERKAELRAEFELQSADQVVEVLGNMRGAMMKLGQMASYLDQGLPEHVRDALKQLQADAPPMSYELVEGVVRSESGKSPEELFAEFDRHPLAAASIGQVHRAVTHEGLEVAVKVQYPGVDQAVAADLDNSDLIFSMLGMLFPGLDPKPIVEELRQRIVEELDYRIEADNQRLFADAFRGHPYIHVPEVVDEFSFKRMLTTEFARGSTFSEVLEWPDEERQLTAECLYRFAFGAIYQLHAFNGDPHPGNYIFNPGGHVTFLDFGLCKRFTAEEVQVFEDMIIAMVIDDDIAEYRRIVTDIGILSPDVEVSDDEVREYFGHFYEFVMSDEVMEITPEWSSQSVRQFFDLSGPHAEIMKAANLPPSMVIIQRINLGLFALFGDLGARGNWRAIAEELWPFAKGEPSTPMGRKIAEWEQQNHNLA